MMRLLWERAILLNATDNPLVEVYERYGIAAPADTAVSTASTGFHIIKGAENTLVQVNGDHCHPCYACS